MLYGVTVLGTCHPAEMTFPPLPQPIKAGTRFSDHGGMQLARLSCHMLVLNRHGWTNWAVFQQRLPSTYHTPFYQVIWVNLKITFSKPQTYKKCHNMSTVKSVVKFAEFPWNKRYDKVRQACSVQKHELVLCNRFDTMLECDRQTDRHAVTGPQLILRYRSVARV